MARQITKHHDGHGLNESINILADDPDQSGASHVYMGSIEAAPVLTLQFQKGPRGELGSTPGVTEAAVLAVLIDRLKGFQEGPYACKENAIILSGLEDCLHWTKARADERASRGVLGKNER